jgi:SAM-dependent methyltransferase
LSLEDKIVSVLKSRICADPYFIHREISGTKMADVIKTIASLEEKRIIYVANSRKNLRTGLSVPIYSLVSRRSFSTTDHETISRVEIECLLAGVPSERAIEYDFLARNLRSDKRSIRILDVGSGESLVGEAIKILGHNREREVFGIDVAEGFPDKSKRGSGLFMRMDARLMGFRKEIFDEIICIGTIEHIGMSSPNYDQGKTDELGDIRAFSEIFRILKKGGNVVLTLPYSDRRLYRDEPDYRIYSSSRVSFLIRHFRVKKKEFYLYHGGKWEKSMHSHISSKFQVTSTSEIPRSLHSRTCLCLVLGKE